MLIVKKINIQVISEKKQSNWKKHKFSKKQKQAHNNKQQQQQKKNDKAHVVECQRDGQDFSFLPPPFSLKDSTYRIAKADYAR